LQERLNTWLDEAMALEAARVDEEDEGMEEDDEEGEGGSEGDGDSRRKTSFDDGGDDTEASGAAGISGGGGAGVSGGGLKWAAEVRQAIGRHCLRPPPPRVEQASCLPLQA
jgi:hypothetical protein